MYVCTCMCVPPLKVAAPTVYTVQLLAWVLIGTQTAFVSCNTSHQAQNRIIFILVAFIDIVNVHRGHRPDPTVCLMSVFSDQQSLCGEWIYIYIYIPDHCDWLAPSDLLM